MRGSGTGSGEVTARNRGQSEVIGTVLLLSVTILVVGGVVAVAGTALDDTRATVETQGAEQSLTLLDSRAALVALGKSTAQEVSLGRVTTGSYTVNESAGSIEITHLDYQGEAATGETEAILPQTDLGAVRYRAEGTTIAYQGGGVWRSAGEGSVMLSPPEFHYRGETLTFPLIRVVGNDSAGGPVRAVLTERTVGQPVFPNASANYNGADPPDRTYRNPIRNGTVRITVHSQYYRAWASYFRQRTTSDVAVYEGNQTVVAELTTVGTRGAFQMPLQGNAIDIRGMKAHSMDDFNVTIYPDEDSADFANLQWSLFAQKGSGETLEYSLYTDGGKLCKDGSRTSSDLVTHIYYTNGSGTYEGWTNRTSDFGKQGGIEIHCPGGSATPYIVANFSGTSTFTYGTVPDQHLYATVSGSLQDPTNFEHDYVTWENDTDTTKKAYFVPGDTTQSGNLTDHYTAHMAPNLDLTVQDRGKGKGSSGSVSERASYGTLHYATGEKVVTFIHITRNEVAVDLR